MTDKLVPAIGGQSFEELKQTNEYGAEYWSARDLQPLLGYSQWRRFEDAVKRAITSCQQSGNRPDHHFAGAGKPIPGGKGAIQVVQDYHLSRFACYLIAQNGDPRKPEIAQAQKYFAVQARRQELTDQLAADLERLEIRKQTAEEFKALSGAAQQAGVQNRMFGVFHDAGYKGLYGGLGNDDIKARKGIPAKDNLMDRMNATELAANQFRMTQTRDKLAREGIRNQQQAIRAHEQVGKEVRAAIERIGGDRPEDIPAAEHITEVEKRLKTATPKLELDERDAGGLLGGEMTGADVMAPYGPVTGVQATEKCPELMELQLRLARSWRDKAARTNDVFAQFLFLYTGFNALYFAWSKADNLMNDEGKEPGEHRQIKHLLEKVAPEYADAVLGSVVSEIRYFTEEREPIQRMDKRTCANPLGNTTEGRKAQGQLKYGGGNVEKLVALGKIVYLIRCNLVHGAKDGSGDDETVINKAIGPLSHILEAAIDYTQLKLASH